MEKSALKGAKFCWRHVMGTLMPLITSHMSEKRFSRVILINRFVLLKVYRLSIFIICFIYKKLTTLIFIASVMTYFPFHYGVQRM